MFHRRLRKQATPTAATAVLAPPPEPQNYVIHGDAGPSIVAAGHSHVLALLLSLQDGRGPVGRSAGVAYYAELRGVPIESAYWDYVAEQAKDQVVVVSWSGNYHLADFLIAGDEPVHVFDPSAPAPTDDGVWIPREMLRAHWGPGYAELDVVLPKLRAAARTVVVLATPPPKRDTLVRRAIGSEPFFAEKATELGVDAETVQLTAEADRLAMWRLTQELLQEHAAENGVQFLPVPPEAVDSDGFLRPECSDPDITHASALYGALVWQALSARLEEEVSV